VSGKVYTFGGGECGQLGMGTNLLDCDTPRVISLAKRIVKISNGENHTACVTDKGHLLTCGSGKHGKLGHGDNNFSNVFTLTRVKRFSKFTVKRVSEQFSSQTDRQTTD
jgi:X-linked retinitis pigmentosa GTPase regulator